MSGRWTGGVANRDRNVRYLNHQAPTLTRAEEHDLFERMADEPFWCECCGQMHPLIEHKDCRNG